MDIIEYPHWKTRMCRSFHGICAACDFFKKTTITDRYPCVALEKKDVNAAMQIVQDWMEFCTGRTHQKLMIRHFPHAMRLKDGVLDICPERVDTRFKCRFFSDCNDCKKKYWSQEVPDDE